MVTRLRLRASAGVGIQMTAPSQASILSSIPSNLAAFTSAASEPPQDSRLTQEIISIIGEYSGMQDTVVTAEALRLLQPSEQFLAEFSVEGLQHLNKHAVRPGEGWDVVRSHSLPGIWRAAFCFNKEMVDINVWVDPDMHKVFLEIAVPRKEKTFKFYLQSGAAHEIDFHFLNLRLPEIGKVPSVFSYEVLYRQDLPADTKGAVIIPTPDLDPHGVVRAVHLKLDIFFRSSLQVPDIPSDLGSITVKSPDPPLMLGDVWFVAEG
jgi:hypothetical protein